VALITRIVVDGFRSHATSLAGPKGQPRLCFLQPVAPRDDQSISAGRGTGARCGFDEELVHGSLSALLALPLLPGDFAELICGGILLRSKGSIRANGPKVG
jgi:hypothetical protein